VKDKRNRAIFELLDARGEGELSIVYLMQLMHNLPQDTMLGQEILKLVKEYKHKNLLSRGSTRKVSVNFVTFNTIIPYSSLID
jgi:hypothetical protein